MAKLQRPLSGRVIAGVCAGIAQRFGWSPTTVRVLFVLSFILPGTQLILYFVMWILVPSETPATSSVEGNPGTPG